MINKQQWRMKKTYIAIAGSIYSHPNRMRYLFNKREARLFNITKHYNCNVSGYDVKYEGVKP